MSRSIPIRDALIVSAVVVVELVVCITLLVSSGRRMREAAGPGTVAAQARR